MLGVAGVVRRWRMGAAVATVAVLAACSEAPQLVDGPLFSELIPDSSIQSVSGNPVCTDYGFDFDFKVDNDGGTNVAGTWAVGDFGTVTITTDADGIFWGWTSTFPVAGVFSKGGRIGANLYEYVAFEEYQSGVYGDSGLVSGYNSHGNPQQISHVDFCFNVGSLTVTKTAATSFTRDFDWSIAKTAVPTVQWSDHSGDGLPDAGYLKFNSGNSAGVAYTVSVFQTGFSDADWAVDGTITVTNGTGIAAVVTDVSDLLSDGTVAATVCPELPLELAPGASMECAYSASLGSAATLVNTATAETDSTAAVTVHEERDGWKLTGSGYVHAGSGRADVVFGEPTTVLDATVMVSDTYAEFGGPLALGNGGSRTYTRFFGDTVCGFYTSTNTASFVGETGEAGSASYAVAYDVVGCGEPPVGACTLTQGYWKTHSLYGPAAHPDATWNLVGGPDARFMSSGLTWLQLFNRAPQGDGYVILAHQYMAAVLNGLNGANLSAVSAEMEAARTLLAGSAPGSLRGRNGDRAKALAAVLDQYNNGLVGPGHCSDAPRDIH